MSGHRRLAACQELGLETMPVIVRDMTNDEATIAMVDANLQRETILPSEKAFAYKMKLDAIKHQGKATSLVDKGKIALNPTVELSYLDPAQQKNLLDEMALNDCTPSHAQAIRLKKMAQEFALTEKGIATVMAEEKPNQKEIIRLPLERVWQFAPKADSKELEDFVLKACEHYRKYLNRQRDRER